MAKNSKPAKKTLIRIIALIMCILLAGSAIYASIVSIAYAETSLNAMYDAGNAALSAFQSTDFVNDTGERIERLPFALYLNQLRRTDALPAGPGGVEIYGVRVNGESAKWSASLDECYIFVECEIAPGEKAEIEFQYSVLLPESKLFAGYGDVGTRLSFFYPARLIFENGEFVMCDMSWAAVPMYFPEDGFTLTLSLPGGYAAAAGVKPEITNGESGSVYEFKFDAARDVSLAISRRYTKYESGAASAFTNNASAAKNALDAANYAMELFNEKLGGDLTYIEIAQVDQQEAVTAHSGVIWLSSDAILKGETEKNVVFGVAKQFFTQSVLASPENEPWLNEAVCAYLTCLYYRERYSESRFIQILNDFSLASLNSTIPGGLSVNSYLSAFNSREEYDAVVKGRGAAALNEVRHALGFDKFWEALGIYYKNKAHSTSSIADFAQALNQAQGASVDYLLMESLMNIADYINQSPEGLD